MLKEVQESETVIVSDETRAVLGIQPKKKRWTRNMCPRAVRLDQFASNVEAKDGLEKRKKAYVHLSRVADKLEGHGAYAADGPIKREVFDLFSWARVEGLPLWAVPDNNIKATVTRLRAALEEAAQNPCGTTACAMGHCALDPYFQKIGVRFIQLGRGADIDGQKAAKALGLCNARFEYFFFDNIYRSGNPSPKIVANRIRHWLESDYFNGVDKTAEV